MAGGGRSISTSPTADTDICVSQLVVCPKCAKWLSAMPEKLIAHTALDKLITKFPGSQQHKNWDQSLSLRLPT